MAEGSRPEAARQSPEGLGGRHPESRLPPVPRPSRSPWQLAYNGVHRLRRRWWEQRAERLPRPVISVGNLHLGGAGKTPLVAAIARHLRDRGERLAILTRGYRRESRGVIVVSTGEGPLVGPSQAGDEPVLLAGELSGVAVVVAERRHEAGRHALERLHPAPDLFLLDDGFSHLRLRRDIDLLAMPAVDPWGGGRLMPSGRLREPLEAVCRADAVVLTGADRQSGAEVAEGLRPYGFRGPGFISRTRAALPARAAREPLAPGSKVLVVTGIARPERFADTVRELGYETVGSLHFADHHAYGDASLARIREAFRATGADCVLTTAKDQVKLVGRLALPVADVPIRAEPEAAFWEWLDRRLEALPGFEAKR